VDSHPLLHIAPPLKLKGDLSTSLPIQLSTVYAGKIKTKKHLHCDPQSEIQGGIRSHTLKIDPGAKIHADVQIGTRIPLWLKIPFSFKKAEPSHE
jgi:cytoskeletal protein CcmA (bactofilin family)